MNLVDTISIVAAVTDNHRARMLNQRWSRHIICYQTEDIWNPNTRILIRRIWLDPAHYREYSLDSSRFERFQVVNGKVHGICINMCRGVAGEGGFWFGNHRLDVPGDDSTASSLDSSSPNSLADNDIAKRWRAIMQYKLLKSAIVCVDGGTIKWLVADLTDGTRTVLPVLVRDRFESSVKKYRHSRRSYRQPKVL